MFGGFEGFFGVVFFWFGFGGLLVFLVCGGFF